MSKVDQLFEGVELRAGFENLQEATTFREDIKFMETSLESLREAGRITLLGFGWSGWQQGTLEVAEEFPARTSAFRLDPDLITVSRYGKTGYAARMYNTAQAVAAAEERPEEFGMYAYSVARDAIRDRRHSFDSNIVGKALRVVHHGGLEVAGLLLGQDRAVYVIDGKQGEAEAVLVNQTVRGGHQKDKHSDPASSVPEVFMGIRRKGTDFTLVGKYKVPKLAA